MSSPPLVLTLLGAAGLLAGLCLRAEEAAAAAAAPPQAGGGAPPAGGTAALDATFRALLEAEWALEIEWSRRAAVPPEAIERANAALAAAASPPGAPPPPELEARYEAGIRAAHAGTLAALPAEMRVRARAVAVARAAELLRIPGAALPSVLAGLPSAARWEPAPAALERAELAACRWRELRAPAAAAAAAD